MSKKPTIDEIARQTPHILNEFARTRGYSGTVDFYQDDIDVKGDGTLWVTAEFEVTYNWSHDQGGHGTPPISDFDVIGVNVKDADFFTNDGEEVEVALDQAQEVLVNYFWDNNLQYDDVLADKVHEQAGMGSREYTKPQTISQL